MTLNDVLFVLRVLAGTLLLGFVGAVFIMMWRDYRAISQEVDTRTRRRGRLVVLRDEGIRLKPGTTFPLLPLTSLGRSPTNTVALNDSLRAANMR